MTEESKLAVVVTLVMVGMVLQIIGVFCFKNNPAVGQGVQTRALIFILAAVIVALH